MNAHPRKPSAKLHDVSASCGSPITTPSALTVAIWNCARLGGCGVSESQKESVFECSSPMQDFEPAQHDDVSRKGKEVKDGPC